MTFHAEIHFVSAFMNHGFGTGELGMANGTVVFVAVVGEDDIGSYPVNANPAHMRPGIQFLVTGLAFRGREDLGILQGVTGIAGDAFFHVQAMRKIQWLPDRGRPPCIVNASGKDQEHDSSDQPSGSFLHVWHET